MAMYSFALVPLVRRLLPICQQIWYADDATDCDTFDKLRRWFNALLEFGPMYGYCASPSKCILVTKPERVALARSTFKGTGIGVHTNGQVSRFARPVRDT